jgi:thioredoxin
MKILILITLTGLFFFFFPLFSENNSETDNQTTSTSSSQNDEHKVIVMNQNEFIEKIFDYKNNKTWSYKGNKPLIIDFYAEWCGPCKMLAPILVEIQQEYKDKIQIYKIDAEKNRELASAFGVNAYPTIFFIPLQGDPAGNRGFLQKADLEKIINEFFKVTK